MQTVDADRWLVSIDSTLVVRPQPKATTRLRRQLGQLVVSCVDLPGERLPALPDTALGDVSDGQLTVLIPAALPEPVSVV